MKRSNIKRGILFGMLLAGCGLSWGAISHRQAFASDKAAAVVSERPAAVVSDKQPVLPSDKPTAVASPEVAAEGLSPAGSARKAEPKKPESLKPAVQAAPAKFNQVVRVWMWGDYVYPKATVARPGPALITLENETQSDVTLALDLPGSANPVTLRLSTAGKAPHTSQVVNLTAGQYVFYDANRPTIKGRLIVPSN